MGAQGEGEGRGWEGYRRQERKGREVGDLKGWEVGEKGEIIQQHFYLVIKG